MVEETGVMGTVEEIIMEGMFLGLLPTAVDLVFLLVECMGILE